MNAFARRAFIPQTLLAFTALWIAPAISTAVPVRVGAPAPALALRQILQAPAGTRGTWDELKGKAVVLEFWATWCGGCVDSIEHVNGLAGQFKSRPVEFISITDETDTELVQRFLGRHPIQGWVAFDANEATFRNYGIEGRPRTVVIDGNGIVQAITNPAAITAEMLEALLAGKPLHLSEETPPQLLGHEPNAPQPLVQVLIRPAAPVDVSGYSPGAMPRIEGGFNAYGLALRNILSQAYNVPEARVDAPEWCSTARYDISVVTPQHEENLRWPLIKQTLEAAFQLRLHTEDKDTRVYVLRRLEGQQPRLKVASSPSNGGHWSSKGELEAEGATTGRLAQVAQSVLDSEVVDETGLSGSYDYQLTWDGKQPGSIIEAVREQLGLELVPGERKRTHLIVDSVQEAKTW